MTCVSAPFIYQKNAADDSHETMYMYMFDVTHIYTHVYIYIHVCCYDTTRALSIIRI